MTIRRFTAAVFAAAIVVAPIATAGAATSIPDRPLIVQGAGLAAAGVAAGRFDPNVDVWPIYSESSMDNDSSHGLSGAIWPGFLLDAFAWLYGLQPQERAGLGISESQWPNPPHSSSASSSGFMIKNFADGCGTFFGGDQCTQFFDAFGTPPAAAGVSSSRSGLLDSSGQARGATFDVPGVLDAAEARSRTSTRFVGGKTVVEAVFTMRDVTIGGALHIDLIEARSVAQAAGTRAESAGKSTLRIAGADFNGTPVTIDDQGLHGAGDSGFDDFNDALKAQGIEVRGSQGRESVDPSGQFVDSASGGLLIAISRQRAEDEFPQPLIEQKNAICASAENSPLNTEITRVRVDQPNPLYGQVPAPGMPKRAQVDQSIPPPAACPFTNRNMGVTLVLGLTDASARLSPLSQVESFGGIELPVQTTRGTGGYTVPGRPARPGTAPTTAVQAAGDYKLGGALASAPRPTTNLPRRVKLLYAVFAAALAVGLGGRFALRVVSSP